MSKPFLILFGHGARDAAWARPMARVREAILASDPQAQVCLAFLEFMQPSLAEAIDLCVGQGAAHIKIVPIFLAQGGHVKRDVPQMLEAARARHPQVRIDLSEAVGEAQSVINAMAAYSQS